MAKLLNPELTIEKFINEGHSSDDFELTAKEWIEVLTLENDVDDLVDEDAVLVDEDDCETPAWTYLYTGYESYNRWHDTYVSYLEAKYRSITNIEGGFEQVVCPAIWGIPFDEAYTKYYEE